MGSEALVLVDDTWAKPGVQGHVLLPGVLLIFFIHRAELPECVERQISQDKLVPFLPPNGPAMNFQETPHPALYTVAGSNS